MLWKILSGRRKELERKAVVKMCGFDFADRVVISDCEEGDILTTHHSLLQFSKGLIDYVGEYKLVLSLDSRVGYSTYDGVVVKGLKGMERSPKFCKDLLRSTTIEGDYVLDPFAGSGVLGEACIGMGRKYLGFELDEGVCKYANRKLESAKLLEMEEVK